MNSFRSPFLFLLCFLLAGLSLGAKELSSLEAHAILRSATRPEKVVGSFISEATTPTKRGTRKVTILTKFYPDGGSCYRKVQVDTPTRGSRPARTKITVKNAAGVWDLSDDQAILMPALFSQEKMMQAMEVVRAARAAGKEPSFEEVFAGDPLLLQCIQIAQHMHFSGEKITLDSRACVQVMEVMDKEGQKLLLKIVKEQISEVKKSLPFMVRLIATPILVTMDLTATLPVRTEYLIDADTGKLISSKRFNSEGAELPSPGKPVREPIPDLADETFAVPTGLTILRPKTLGEYLSLHMKAQKAADAKAKTGSKPEDKKEEEEVEQ